MVRRKLTAIAAIAVVSGFCVLAGTATTSPARAAECTPPPTSTTPMTVVVGTVACQQLTSHLLGNGVAAPFEYYVPPQCDPALHRKCPVLYLLHRFGGDYTEMLDSPGSTTSAWIQAETKQPPAGFESTPWKYADPRTWVPA